MNHSGTKRLETERLILRRFAPGDAGAMYQNWASDPEVTKYLMWPTHKSIEVSEYVLRDWLGHYEEENYYHWAITVKAHGDEPIGDIAIVLQREEIGLMHIGYCISRAWWHKGVTSEALQAVMDFLFDTVGVNRIEARHDPRNVYSGRVMQKCGMRYEGTLRSADRNNQGICDAAYYALLRSER